MLATFLQVVHVSSLDLANQAVTSAPSQPPRMGLQETAVQLLGLFLVLLELFIVWRNYHVHVKFCKRGEALYALTSIAPMDATRPDDDAKRPFQPMHTCPQLRHKGVLQLTGLRPAPPRPPPCLSRVLPPLACSSGIVAPW